MNNNIAPFLLRPVGKDYLWGGNRLNELFHKQIDLSPLAETWECSTHPAGPCTVGSGRFIGMSLTELLSVQPQILGSRHAASAELPILVKFIDARQDLSVQVHPDDEYAAVHEQGQRGKTELWYVLDAAPGAQLVYGLLHDMEPSVLRCSISEGTLERYLQRVDVRKGDLFMIEPGTIHAIGAGVLLAEIQESSDLTYRLYDYDRIDKTGKKRELHVEKALAVADLHAAAAPRQPLRVLRYSRGCAHELLYRCRYFQVERLLLNSMVGAPPPYWHSDSLSFQVLLCVSGRGVLRSSADELAFSIGDCIFIPADQPLLQIEGKAELLKIRC